jgi:hypothetical protein
MMDKLRPFAQQHTQALANQKAHYLRLIEDERQQNLELRLEQSRWQESLGRLNENLRLALIAQTEGEGANVRKIAALRTQNASLRRKANLPPMSDSDEEDDDEAEDIEREVERLESAGRSQGGSPEGHMQGGKSRLRIGEGDVWTLVMMAMDVIFNLGRLFGEFGLKHTGLESTGHF